MACHQARPSGMSALPVIKVDVLQFMTSPVEKRQRRIVVSPDNEAYNSRETTGLSMFSSRHPLAARHHSVQDRSRSV